MPTVELSGPPHLARLYATAVLGAVRPGAASGGLPGTTLRLADTPVDRDRLADYARECGFRLTDTLPATFPHLLAFELQMAVMADPAFPLPLPGMVHIHNTITLHRPIDAGERLTLTVHAQDLRPHPKGTQLDLISAITVAGEPSWSGVSTYLCRGRGADPEAPREARAEDVTGPPTATWRVDAGTGRRYAAISGDVNPIHLHPLAARAFGFPRTVVHGMWTAARALAALEGRLPETFTYDVTFGRPLLLPSAVELRTRPAEDGGWNLDVRSSAGRHIAATITTTPS